MAGETLQSSGTGTPSVVPSEAQLSEFDDIPDDVITGMSGNGDEGDDGSGGSQPSVGLSAHEDDAPATPSGVASETPTESTESGGESNSVEGQPQQPASAEQPVAEETPEQREAREKEVAERRQKYVAELQTKYTLSPEDAEKALLKPEELLPKLAAELHANVLEEVVRHVQLSLPSMLTTVTKSDAVEQKARSDFFSANKDLNKPEYEQAIVTAGRMFRHMNPKAKPEEAIVAIGRLARVALGLPEPTGDENTSGAPSGKPFKPARPGGGGMPPAPRRTATKPTEGEPDWGEFAKDD